MNATRTDTWPRTGDDAPLLSVFVPVWNGSGWLPGVIESVLAQDWHSWELIIGDNDSSEDLEAIVARFQDPRIRYHRWESHTDLYENFNRTLELCRSEWVVPLCVDDRLRRGSLKSAAAALSETEASAERVVAVIGASRRVDPNGLSADAKYYEAQGRRPMAPGAYTPFRWLELASSPGLPPWNMGSVVLSRSVLAEMGGFFRPEFGLCADQEVMLRVSAYGNIVYVDEEWLDYTVTFESDSNTREADDKKDARGLPSLAEALLSGLRMHEYRRPVTQEERSRVFRAVSHACLRRAAQHRLRAGGRGRLYAFLDLFRAFRFYPRNLLSPVQLLSAAAIILAPASLLRRFLRKMPRSPKLARGLNIAATDRLG